jgi:histidinol-phosphate aminotransferase
MNLFNKKTNELKPYVVSERSFDDEEDWLILDWNESTYRIGTCLKESLIHFINEGKLNLYGDVDCSVLRKKLYDILKIDEFAVSFFNGSDSALNICFESILENGDEVLIIEPEYSQVDTFIKMKGGVKNSYLLKSIDKPSIVDLNNALIGKKVFYFSNPNNPIGYLFSESEIENMVITNPSVMFFVDEAYYEFSGSSAINLISKFSNLIIFRTFSKAFGLAGIRLGYVVSAKENISMINKVRNGKEVSTIAQLAAITALDNYLLLESRIQEVISTRNWFVNELSKLVNFEFFQSSANFLLIKHDNHEEIISKLIDSKILVRDRTSMHMLKNCFRITIGNKSEMERVLAVLKLF